MKFEQVVKDAIESQIHGIETSPTEQSNTQTHQDCCR